MPRPRSDIDLRIVHAARAAFLAEGVDGASLRAIAKGAKTSVGMVSYYFPTKDDLFLAVVEEIYAALLRELDAVLAQPLSLAKRLEKVSVRIGRMTDHELDVVRIVVREALLSQQRLRRVFERFKRGHIPMLVGALGAAIAAGEIDDSIPIPVLIGATFGAIGIPQVMLRAVGSELPFPVPTPEATAAAATRILFRGARKRRRRGDRPRPRKPRSVSEPPSHQR